MRLSVRKLPWKSLLALPLAVGWLAAQAEEPEEGRQPDIRSVEDAAISGSTGVSEEGIAATESSDRTQLNLLGEVDSEGGEGRRNENVELTLIDNNVLKEIIVRMGATATLIQDFQAEKRYFGAEFGNEPSELIHIQSPVASAFHGTLFWSHNNSVFNARSFFQVGDVKPAHSNDYGFDVSIPIWRGGSLALNGSRGRLLGQVNGNVLVPAVDERTPLTTDPEDLPIVQAILGAYPDELPNRTDMNRRALNTNAPQTINNNRGGATLDQLLGDSDRLIAQYQFTLQQVEAFQLVGGQNPDTTTRNPLARLTWTRTWSPGVLTDFTLGFDRVGSLLVPEETSLGPFYHMSNELQIIGPHGKFPIDRAQNAYRFAARTSVVHGNHSVTFGAGITRRQTNGSESHEHRGLFVFATDMGRDAVTNLRMGTPSLFRKAFGSVHRGFRDWIPQFYLGDTWRATPDFTINLGLRYEPLPKPNEVNDLSEIPYTSDLNNFAPTFGLAYRLPGRWGTMRANYGLHHGEIYSVTYMQTRFNPPSAINVSVRGPKLSDPLKDFDENDIDPNTRSMYYAIAPDLRTPYSHLYGLTWSLELAGDWTLDMGYVGSRSHKLFTIWYLNRAEVVEGIPQTIKTIDDRRPDPRYNDVLHVPNGSRGYYDAAKATLRIPRWAGLNVDVSYWFSKAIDNGADYANTTAWDDRGIARSVSVYKYREEVRSVSGFDQPHSMLARVNYETPSLAGRDSWTRTAFSSWEFGTVALFKSGTPFTVYSGSDAPGWGNVDGVGSDNPILLDPSILGRSIDDPDTSAATLPRSAFATMAPDGIRGNLGKHTFRKDGIANINVSVSKRWMINGEKSVLFRTEALNLLNHPQFERPGYQLSSGDFGRITNTLNDGRAFQFSLQFAF